MRFEFFTFPLLIGVGIPLILLIILWCRKQIFFRSTAPPWALLPGSPHTTGGSLYQREQLLWCDLSLSSFHIQQFWVHCCSLFYCSTVGERSIHGRTYFSYHSFGCISSLSWPWSFSPSEFPRNDLEILHHKTLLVSSAMWTTSPLTLVTYLLRMPPLFLNNWSKYLADPANRLWFALSWARSWQTDFLACLVFWLGAWRVTVIDKAFRHH